MTLLDDFIRYVKVSTQSDEDSHSAPSSINQLDLLNMLKDELLELSLEPELDEFGRLYVNVVGNEDYPCIGLCAHVDTASELSGENVNPQIIRNYNGGDILLGKSGFILSPNEYPNLKRMINKTIITTDGTTLLGADDKAGVAIIMSVLKEYLLLEKNKRYPLSIVFTPDEEIGRGAEHLNLDKFKAEFAYTIDGASPFVIEKENFFAASAALKITGVSIHPGDAKGVMINALKIVSEFDAMLPRELVPEKTEMYEGFNHLNKINGTNEYAEAHYIIRNHDKAKLDEQIRKFEEIREELLNKYKKIGIELGISYQYKNMKEIIDRHPEVITRAEKAYKHLRKEFSFSPIRGGTDGATFSYMGCPTPNLGTGSYNHHGRFEYAVLEEMEFMVELLKAIFMVDVE